jgi:hypothetical protein
MRRALILLALLPLLVAPVGAQVMTAQSGLPRARCDYGQGVAALRDSARELARAPSSLEDGRTRGEAAATRLRAAVPVFLGCGCERLAVLTAEAGGLAAGLGSEASVARLIQGFEQTRLRIGFAQEQMDRQGCR